MRSFHLHISSYLFYLFIPLCLMIGFATFKSIDLLPDMAMYKKLYLESVNIDTLIKPDVESSYYYISRLTYFICDSFRSVIFIYVSLSLFIKLLAFKFFEKKYLLCFLYICFFFLLHELIQVRIGLASSLLFLGSCVILFQQRYIKGWILFALAIWVHTSAILFVFGFLYAEYIRNNKKYLIPSIIFLLFIAGISIMNTISLIEYLPSRISEKFQAYTVITIDNELNFNLFSIRNLTLYSLLIIYFNRLFKLDDIDFVYFLTVFIITVSALLFSSLPDLSIRFIDLAMLFSFPLVVNMHRYYSPFFSRCFTFCFIFILLYNSFILIRYVESIWLN
jgi:hypothetical protein